MARQCLIPRGLPRSVWLTAATGAILMSGFGMIIPLIPIYGQRLGASSTELGLLMAAFFAGRLLAQIPAGLAADRLGRRPILIGALIGYTATCIAYANAADAIWLIVFRLAQGSCSGFFAVAARSLLSDLCGPELRGTAQGIYSSSVNLGFVTGPVFGVLASEYFSITAPFWAAAVLSCIALIVFTTVVKPTPEFNRLSRRLTNTKQHLQNKLTAKAKFPILRRLALYIKTPRIRILAGINLLFMAGLSVIMTLFPITGESEIPGGLTIVGVALTTAGISGLILGPIAGRASDKIGRHPIMLLGALLAATEGISLLLSRDPMIIIMAFFLGGVGVAAFFNALHAAVGDLTNKRRRGTVTGLIGLAGECGGIAGCLLVSATWAQTDLHLPFALQLIFTAVLAVLVVWLWRLRGPRLTKPAKIRETIIPG